VARLKRNVVLAVGLGVAVYLVIIVAIDLDGLREALARFDLALIPLILGLVSLSYAVRFLRWTYYLRLLRVRVPLGANVAIFAAGLSMAISPGKLGEVLKSVFVKDVSGAPIARTAPTVVAERATDGTGMVAWGLIGALTFSFGPWVLLGCLALTAVGIAVLRSKGLSLLAERTMERLPVVSRFAPQVGAFHGASNELLGLRPLLVASAISFCAWGLEILAVYLCVVGVGAGAHFLVVAFIFAGSSLAGAFFFTPGGLGVAEAGIAGGLRTLAGLPWSIAGALTILIRLATLWYAMLVGVVGLLVVRWVIGEPVEEAVAEAEVGSGREA
jgi:uncharacterized protein (TIRG00374 family)